MTPRMIALLYLLWLMAGAVPMDPPVVEVGPGPMPRPSLADPCEEP
jgi:hypothetical protein